MQTLKQATDDVRRYRGDLSTYAEDCLRIRTKDARLTPLILNRAQRFVHQRVSEQLRSTGAVRAIILKARQEGVSTYTAARCFRRLNLYRQQNALVIADQKKRSATLFAIYDLFWRMLPEHMRPYKRYAGKTELWFDSRVGGVGLNSKVAVETAKDVEAGRAATIQFLHASEHAFWDHAEDVWAGLMQAVPDQGSEVIIESTANGVGNLFHEIWTAAEEGDSGFTPIFLPWWIHEEYTLLLSTDAAREVAETASDAEAEWMTDGIVWEGERHQLTPGQIAWRRQTIRDKLNGNERTFRQEYPATPREAFLVSGNCFFDDEVLLAYERGARPPTRANIISIGAGVSWSPSERGYLRIWAPPGKGRHYAMFADTATGRSSTETERVLADPESERGGRDFSCAYVIDVYAQQVVACLHGRIPPETFATQLNALGYIYACSQRSSDIGTPAFLGVERNHSSGETVLRELKERLRYPRLYYMRRMNQRTQRVSSRAGWMTTVETRMPMLDDLAAALRDGSLGLPDRDAIRECFTFIRGKDGKPEAQEGCHDDRVIALAGAMQMVRYYPSPASGYVPKLEVADTPTGY